jgi:hypothetical protein
MINCNLLRKCSISLMATLAMVSLLWGNCLSCPQMMAALTSHPADHSCCHKPQPASARCHTEDLRHFVKTDTHAPVAPAVAEWAGLAAPAVLPAQRFTAPPANVHAPPGDSNSPLALRI